MTARLKVGIDLAAIAFRHRAPGTAVHIANQAMALLKTKVDWDWVLVATPRVLEDSPEFAAWNPIIVPDIPLSLHATFRVGYLWARAGCALGLATVFFAPVYGPPVVVNYFDASAHFTHESPQYTIKFRILQLLATFSRWRSRALFILSDYGRRRMLEVAPATAGKWVVTYCGCPAIPPAPALSPPWAASLRDRRFILYSGEMNENKNQRRLIAAWDLARRRHPDFPALVLIGPSVAAYRQDIIEAARMKTAFPDEVIIPGYVPRSELAWAFRKAHAYVQPSFAEGFGLPIIEAMSCGVPVACSNTTSLPEVAGGAALLFDPANVEDIATVLSDLVNDEERRQQLRAAGTIRAQDFTWEAHAAIVAERIRIELQRLR